VSFASTPNLTDFTTYVQSQGVTATYLPVDSPWLQYALDYGVNWTLQDSSNTVPAITYVIACYNCGMHFLLRNCPDQPGETFFATQRQTFNLNGFVAGPVMSSSDEGTSQTLGGSTTTRDLPLPAMSFIKTPWGQQYLEYQQAYGPNVVGVS